MIKKILKGPGILMSKETLKIKVVSVKPELVPVSRDET